MKKPNLTEGEWKFDKDGCCVLDTSDHIIVDTYQPFQVEYICNNNGRACSAVPDMIDALFLSYRLLMNINQIFGGVVEKDIKIIEKALEKSGVEL